MDLTDRKLQQKIARRKEKVQRMIGEHNTRLDSLDAATFLRQEDYHQAVNKVRKKLSTLEHELSLLDSGQLPGAWK